MNQIDPATYSPHSSSSGEEERCEALSLPMDINPGQSVRLNYLDGLRGLAALQVVLLHYVMAFMPVLAMAGTVPWYPATMPGWQAFLANTPFIFLINGYSAVYIFFLMSGFVLRAAYERIDSFAIGVWRRLIRLWIPTVTAVIIAGLLLAFDYNAHFAAAKISGSTKWLGALMLTKPTIAAVTHDALFNSLLLGYQRFSALHRVIELQSLNNAFDAPVWTLNIELVGSLVCLVLSLIGQRNRSIRGILIVTFALFAGANQIFLFVIGFMLAGIYPRRVGWIGQCAGTLALISGVLLCRLTAIGSVLWLHKIWFLGHTPGTFQFTNQIGAILVFVGVLNLPVVHNILATRVPQYLGRISFSLYLVHFPIMATLGCSLFVNTEPVLGVVGASFVALIVGLVVTLPAATLFERWIDRPAVRLSRRALRRHLSASQASGSRRSGLMPARTIIKVVHRA
ncbi:MAG TPA: acyltransferase [Acidocella sp.]|jgi:peptidoglycan/LPS O-acetylase OafA/YrhL|nr:acyltransferase [Acidocella sp.]